MISSRSLNRVTLIAFVVLSVLSSAAFAGCTAGSQISLSVHPNPVPIGGVLTVVTGMNNPTASNEGITVKYTLKLPNGTMQRFGAVILPVFHGSSLTESFSFPIPSHTVLGTYRLIGNATNQTGAAVGSCSASVTVN